MPSFDTDLIPMEDDLRKRIFVTLRRASEVFNTRINALSAFTKNDRVNKARFFHGLAPLCITVGAYTI